MAMTDIELAEEIRKAIALVNNSIKAMAAIGLKVELTEKLFVLHNSKDIKLYDVKIYREI
jgi:hypothetical protein